jgi:hypothetical protein
MGRKAWLVGVIVAAFFGLVPSMAGAQVLGSVAPPANASPMTCDTQDVWAQLANTPGTPYTVPMAGTITQWQTNTSGDQAGDAITLVVLRPTSTHAYTVLATDAESLPTPLPSGNVATFNLANPISVAQGDIFGLFGPSSSVCFYERGEIPSGGIIGGIGVNGGSAPAPGTNVSPTIFTGPPVDLNFAATFIPTPADAGVSTLAGPTNATTGYPAVLSSIVANAGPGTYPITFTDVVPAGLTIDSAVAGSGVCVTAAQTVTCTIIGLAPRQSAPVQIVVTPGTNGIYENLVSVGLPSGVPDPNTANDTASSVLLVAPVPPAPPTPRCVVPRLKGIPAWFAERVLGLLGCQVGKLSRVHSRGVAKGSVISSTPGAGTYPVLKVISLQVSSGPAPKHKHHRAHRARR